MKTYNIPYGIEISDLSPRQGSDELRKKLEIPKSAKIAVTVSDMIEKQDIVNILRAFQQVVIKKPSSYLIIVGDGPYFKEIEREMLNLALGSHVILIGPTPPHEVADYIDLAHVFINIGGRTSGFLICPADVGALSQLLLGLFLGNIPAEVIGKNARNKALDIFDTKKMVQETLGAYESILNRSSWVKL